MSLNSCLSRIQKATEALMTVNRLQRLNDMSGKGGKPCTCSHHKSTSKKENLRCACRPRPKICLCDQSDGIIEHLGTDEDFKLQFANGPEHSKSGRGENPEKIAVAIQTKTTANKSIEATDSENFNGDMKDIEQMYKDLENERKRNRELEEKLETITCSIKCIKDENEQQANCLKDCVEKAKNQAKLAARSRNLAMDLAKQSRDQTDLVKASRDELLKQINGVKEDNNKLHCECEELRSKLKIISQNESKKCAEVDEKVNRMKSAVKQKEMALACENSELEKTVTELSNLVKIQKKRISDLTSICTKQRSTLQNNENCMSSKIAQLSEAENKIQSMTCRCKKLQEEIDCLKCCLENETAARKKLEAEFDERYDNCNCAMQIKDKIIADQVETIKKLKKLLQDSEKMANRAGQEFESLRDELQCLKQTNKSLRLALEDAEAQIVSDVSLESETDYCERCQMLEERLSNLAEQKQKALAAAKFAAEKLCKTTAEYQRLLDCEKRQHRFVADLVHRKEAEIELLKKEILHDEKFRCRRQNEYIVE